MPITSKVELAVSEKENLMSDSSTKSVIKRVYVPTQVYDLPNGERLKIPGHYKTPPKDESNDQ